MIAPGDYGKIDTQSMTVLLGYEMKSRGTDATGILTVDTKGRHKLRKKPWPADVFLAARDGIGCSAQTLLLHTRAATQGRASVADNNHPIKHGGIIGIHNGIIWNDDKLFEHFKWPRNAQVDSEAIFAALNYLPMEEALLQIDGGWAIAWVDTDIDPRKLWLARGNQSPLNYTVTDNGSVIFASTHGAVKDALEYGGVTGTPDIKLAPEGFLAYADPDQGGLVIMPSFDSSGDQAIGHRTKVNNYVHAGSYMAGTSWEHDSELNWYAKRDKDKTPMFVRQTITGDEKNPKPGDRRKYLDSNREWIFETCTSASPQCWARLHESKITQAEPTPSLAELVEEFEGTTEAVMLPFDRPGDELTEEDFVEPPDTRYGFAGVGDLICIPKKLFSNDSYGGIIGIVTDYDEGAKELSVEWRPGRIDLWAEYEVLTAAQKGA